MSIIMNKMKNKIISWMLGLLLIAMVAASIHNLIDAFNDWFNTKKRK